MSSAEEEPPADTSFNPGAKAGVAFGVILSVLLIVGIPAYIIWQKRKYREGVNVDSSLEGEEMAHARKPSGGWREKLKGQGRGGDPEKNLAELDHGASTGVGGEGNPPPVSPRELPPNSPVRAGQSEAGPSGAHTS